MQFMGVWSLNRDLMTSLGLSHTPNLPKIIPHLQRCISIRVHPCAHPQHIKVLKHFCIYMIWMRDAIYGGLEGRPTDKTTRKPAKNAF